ncbi:MAG: hypothetical protein RIS35_3280 [Pseudomonadota bacterium]
MDESRKTAQQQLFGIVGRASRGLGRLGRPLSKRLFPGPREPGGESDWGVDADWARLQEEPIRARGLLWTVVGVFAVLLVWSAFARIDEVSRGAGKVIPSRQLQVVQSVDGGIVEEILVREGAVVDAGQLLLRVDPTRFVSSLRENRSQFLSLRARAARLEALTQGGTFKMPQEVLRDAPEIAAQERSLYVSSKAEVGSQVSMAQEQLAQRRQELNDARSRRAQAERSLELVQKELSATRPLLSTGAVSEVELLRLEREISRLTGDRDQATALIARSQAAIAEATQKIQEVELNMRNVWRNQLSETMARLSSLSEGSLALEDRVKHAEIRAPVRGTVSRLLVNTVGGVVQPGKEVVEIVPLDDALILEARVAPKDIAFLRPGQKAIVKFTAYDFAVYGGLDAVLELISADSVTDDQGNSYYLVRVRTLETTLGQDLPIIPGMMAEVDILTGKKTILAYLLKPVLRAKANALSER